jgi:MFS family permease
MEVHAGSEGRREAPLARPPHWRWNFATLGGDIGFFVLGLNISSAQTILPLFVNHLSPSNEAVALISAIRALGIYGPQLLVAPLVERMRLAKPMILGATVFERVPFLVLAVTAVWLAGPHPSGLLVLFYVMIFVQQFAGGLTYPAWLDLIARTIPQDWRGRFFGWWSGMGGIAGIGGAALAALILLRVAWPLNFSLIFGLTFAAFVVSFVLLALGREPPRPLAQTSETSDRAHSSRTAPGRVRGAVAGVGRQSRDLAQVVRADAGLRWLVGANAAAGVSTMGAALFAVSALKQGGLSAPQVGAESTVLVIATTLGNFLWGAWGDRHGHRSVLIGAALSMAAAAGLALGAHGFAAYAVVFLLLGSSLTATVLAQLTFITEVAPAARRPTYIALTSVVYAPFAVGAPIVGGWIADRWSYSPVFVISVAAGLVAACIYRFRVPEPRRSAKREAPSAAA